MVKKKDSVPAAAQARDQDPDRKSNTAIIVINGYEVIAHLEAPYIREHMMWENKCAAIPRDFRKKTSRTVKNDKVYESTIWYKVKPDGGLESVGKEEPDYSKYYPPEPKLPYSFKFQRYQDHVILEEKDYLANQKLFNDCLVFALEDCRNYSHPLYANPEKALKSENISQNSGETTIECQHRMCSRYVRPGGDSTGWGMVYGKWFCETHYPEYSPVFHSVRKGVGISGRSPGSAGQNIDQNLMAKCQRLYNKGNRDDEEDDQ